MNLSDFMSFSRFISACFLLAGFSPFSGFAEVVTNNEAPAVTAPRSNAVSPRSSVKKSASRAIAESKKKHPVRDSRIAKTQKKSVPSKKKIAQTRAAPRAFSKPPAPMRVQASRTRNAPVGHSQPGNSAPLYANSPQPYTASPTEQGSPGITYLKPLAPAAEKQETIFLDLVPKEKE